MWGAFLGLPPIQQSPQIKGKFKLNDGCFDGGHSYWVGICHVQQHITLLLFLMPWTDGSGWGSWETCWPTWGVSIKVKSLVPHTDHPPLSTWEIKGFSHSSSFTVGIEVIPRSKGADLRAKEKLFNPELVLGGWVIFFKKTQSWVCMERSKSWRLLGEKDEYDQNSLYETLKELIKWEDKTRSIIVWFPHPNNF